MVKSDDSKRQDAAKAAEQNDKAGTVDAGQLLDQLQGKAAEVRSTGNFDAAAQIELALKMATQALALAERSQSSQEDRLRTLEKRGVRGPRRKLLSCPVCHQDLWDSDEKRGCCRGEHVRVMIAPTNHAMWRHFQGVFVNGVKYIGRCDVPPALVDSLRAACERSSAAYLALQVGKTSGMRTMPFELATAKGISVIR